MAAVIVVSEVIYVDVVFVWCIVCNFDTMSHLTGHLKGSEVLPIT